MKYLLLFCVIVLYIQYNQIECGKKFVSNLHANCMKCLCQATSLCNMTIGCQYDKCGPFLISKEYWRDADRPTLKDDDPDRTNAYNDCMKDYDCASSTVVNYAAKYAYDCNKDGVTDCEDYARLHWYGKGQCEKSIATLNFGRRFSSCKPVGNWS